MADPKSLHEQVLEIYRQVDVEWAARDPQTAGSSSTLRIEMNKMWDAIFLIATESDAGKKDH